MSKSKVLILLVEDQAEIRLLLSDALEDGGYEVQGAGRGQEAMKHLDDASNSVRGLITDIDLGRGPNGWQVARHAREIDQSIAVVYMSGGSAQDWASQGVPQSTMVAKPFAAAQVVTAMSNLLNQSDQ